MNQPYETVEIYRNTGEKLATVDVGRAEWSAIAWVDYITVDSKGIIIAEFHAHAPEHLANMQTLVSQALAR